jgi:multisubunit Na+/H+ antiporter MnhE subunit
MWVFMVGKATWDSALLGFIISLAAVTLLEANLPRKRLPFHFQAVLPTLIYTRNLLVEILTSDFDVALKVFSRKGESNSGVVRLPVGNDNVIAGALSAHSITSAPGSFVVGYEDEGQTMLVHLLDKDSIPELQQQQQRRFALLERIISRE